MTASRDWPRPDWFSDAVDTVPERYTVEVEGCEIRYRAWGDAAKPVLVLVHGGGAHSGWWDHVAPFFTTTHRVLAPDLSGHGDSGARDEYSLGTWAREVLAVSVHADRAARPTLVGHSMGGWVASMAALAGSNGLDGVVVVDSPIRERAPEAQRLRRRGRPDGYRSKDQIVARFHAVPRQESTLPFVAEHIAADSVRRKGLRWFWKFDPVVFQGSWLGDLSAQHESLDDVFDRMRCRTSYFRCEHGLVPPDMANRIRQIPQLRGPFVELPEAGHHPMLDQPLALVAALRTLLEVWSIT